eukprot:113355-Rhodomonas_salina.2
MPRGYPAMLHGTTLPRMPTMAPPYTRRLRDTEPDVFGEGQSAAKVGGTRGLGTRERKVVVPAVEQKGTWPSWAVLVLVLVLLLLLPLSSAYRALVCTASKHTFIM